MKRVAQGLTLVEVLAALAILSLLAGVCVPLFVECRQALNDGRTQDDAQGSEDYALVELAALADAAVTAPPMDAVTAEQLDGSLMDWPTSRDGATAVRPPVQLRLMSGAWAGDESEGYQTSLAEHAWLVFRCGGRVAVRWVKPSPRAAQREAAP